MGGGPPTCTAERIAASISCRTIAPAVGAAAGAGAAACAAATKGTPHHGDSEREKNLTDGSCFNS